MRQLDFLIPGDLNAATGGYIYGRDDFSSHYFSVVRQGRFLQYGYNQLVNRPYTGLVYFFNLVARMYNY